MPKIKGLSFTVIVPAILCSIYSTSVSADPRPYVAVDLGVTNASASRMIRDIGVTECDQGLVYLERCDASNSGRGWAGYLGVGMQLSPGVAVELGYFDIADDTDTVHITAESSMGTGMEGWQNINVKISAITLRGIVQIPVSETVSFNVSLGLSQLDQRHKEVADYNFFASPQEVRNSGRNTVPTFGAGVNYQITENWTLRGQYMALPAPAYLRRVDDRLISAGTIGLMYTF